MKKSFTLIELVVAVALLAMVFAFAGVIFKVSINSYRTAVANAEIIQKLRAITDQLNADFKGICTDAPLLIWFYEDNSATDPNRYDQIMFFADGDFQSTQLYKGVSNAVPAPDGDKLVIGNVARIFYGQTQPDPNLLARRQHILTADPCLINWPSAGMSDFDGDDGSSSDDRDRYNELYEHDRLSLTQWKIIDGSVYDNKIIPTCFDIRPLVDKSDPNTFHKLMCEGLGSFAIQWAYWDSVDGRFYWYPSDDPDGNGNSGDSHFYDPYGKFFGVLFKVPNSFSFGRWYPIGDINIEYRSGSYFLSDFYPKALKFTFKLYDSKGVFKEGRKFTHIVYLGE